MGPTRFERAHHRSRRWVLPGYTKGPVVAFRGVGGSADPRGQSPSGRRPHHWWPRAAAFRFSRSQRTRRRISRVRFVRNHITSVSLSPINRGRANRTPTAGSTVPNAAVTPRPAKRRSRRTRRALALNTLESPPRAVSDSSWRCGSWCSIPGGRVYFKVSLRSETDMRPWDGMPAGRNSWSHTPTSQ